MKVALVGPYPVDLSRRPGGVISAVIYLAQGLRQLSDVELHIVTTTKEVAQNTIVQERGATVHYLAEARKRIVPNLLANVGRIRDEIRKIDPDVVHSEAPVGTVAGLEAGYPTVHTIHGIAHREVAHAPGLKRKLAVWMEGRLGLKAVARAKHCIPTSGYAAEAFDGLSKAMMHLIYNPIDDAFFEVPNNEEPHRLLFGGNVIERKNVLGHLEVVRRLVGKYPDLKLRVAGGATEPEYHDRCTAFVAEHGLSDNVDFLGSTTVEQMREEMSMAKMLLLFSKQETAPLVIGEALCAGLPVVCSTAGGNASLVRHGETGYVAEWHDTDSFVKYVDAILSDEDLRADMRRKAREDARERFWIPAVTAKHIEVYKEAIADR